MGFMKKIGFLSFGHWTPSPQSQTRNAADTLLQSIELAVAAIGAANILLAFLFLFPRRNFAMIAAIVPVLFVMYIVDDALPFTPISSQSARYLADQIRADEIGDDDQCRVRPSG